MTDNDTAAELTADPALSAEPTVADSSLPAAEYTGDDIAKAREQEKNKLYPQMEKMREELSALKAAEAEREAKEAERREQRRLREAEAADKKKREEEETLELRELLQKKEVEWQEKLEAERLERERAFALLEREREYQEVTSYRSQRIEQERDNIVPELIDLVQGNSVDEIEQSINVLKDKSARILDSVSQAAQSSRKELQGASLTGLPASGPIDNNSDPRSYSPDDLSKMSMADYAKNRPKLLGGASNNRGQGLFGN
jgi:hypothetical protein